MLAFWMFVAVIGIVSSVVAGLGLWAIGLAIKEAIGRGLNL